MIRYSILILSPIPVYKLNGVCHAMDLWARDLNTQTAVAAVKLICPVLEHADGPVVEIDRHIEVLFETRLNDSDLTKVVSQVDVVQLPGHAGWTRSALARRLLKIAKRLRKPVILGVSSNRAKTAWLNSSNWIRGSLRYLDIRSCQIWMAIQCDGVFVVGNGLRDLFARYNRNIFTGTASWIEETDIAPPPPPEEGVFNICLASRMEKMKGMHIGICAFDQAKKETKQRGLDLHLTIIGAGPEEENLKQQVHDLGLSPEITFRPMLPYPKPFLDWLRTMDAVLLTNLNDEQPRLIFDALSQGCLPVCPDRPAYRDLGLDDRLFYQQGSAGDLARVIEALSTPELRLELSAPLRTLARHFTIQTMHKTRAEWILCLLKSKVAQA